jgi:hypothetical protein
MSSGVKVRKREGQPNRAQYEKICERAVFLMAFEAGIALSPASTVLRKSTASRDRLAGGSGRGPPLIFALSTSAKYNMAT